MLFGWYVLPSYLLLLIRSHQDAHADLNSPQISESGNVHGMSVGFLMNLHNCKQVLVCSQFATSLKRTQTPGFEWMQQIPTLLANRIVYIGLRDIDTAEKVPTRSHLFDLTCIL